MGTPSAAGSLPPAPRGDFAHRKTWCLAAQSEHPRAPWSCPRRPCRYRRDLAPQRIEAAPPAPVPRLLLPSAGPFPWFVGGTWLPEDSDPTDPRNGLRELFQTLADELQAEAGHPRDIAARPRKAGDEAARNQIGSNSEDNGDSVGRLLGGQGMGLACGHDDINLERNQFGRKSG